MLSGRNTDNNKVSVLNVDDDGRVKIDESGKLTQMYNYTINNDIRYLRSQGQCFCTSYNYVGTAETKNMISLWNPSASGKKLYLYRINCQFDNDGAGDYATRVILYGTSTEPTSGTTQTPRNLQIGSNNTSSAVVRQNFNFGANYVIAHLMTADEPGAVQNTHLDFNEYIEILPGNGVWIMIYMNTSTNKMRAMSTFYYAETSATIPS